MRAADLMSTDVVTYFVQSQIPVAVCVIATVAIGHFFVQRWFDQRDAARGVADGAPVKLSLQTGILVSILIAFFVDLITHFDFKECCKHTSAVFEGMGKVFTSTVALICCAELFALGMNKMGGITTMIQAAAAMESAGVWVMLFIMLGIMVVATIVTGSGNAAFFAFSPLLPEAAASVGINTAVLVVPVQLSAGIARTMCPIAGVIIAVAGIAGLTPFEIIRRTIPVMLLALIVNVAASAVFL